ncbi:unnamed protein product [Closterium sp. NIES-53]
MSTQVLLGVLSLSVWGLGVLSQRVQGLGVWSLGSLLQLASPLPGPSPYSGPTRGLTERRKPESRPVSPESCPASPESRSDLLVNTVRAGRRVPRQRPPPVPGTHSMTLRPSTAPQHVPLPSPPLSSLPDGPDPESDSLRAASPTVTRFLASAVTDPLFESTAASSLVTERVDFAAACRLDYATSLVAESASASVCPPSVRGECALRTDVLEDRQEEFECFSAARREGPYSSQWQAAMDAEMASWKSTGTYVEEVPPPGVNIVSGMWIFRSLLQLASPLPGPSPYSGPTRGLTERRKPESRPVSPESCPASPESRSDLLVNTVRAGRRVPRQRPPPVPGTHSMTLRPSTAPQHVPLPSPPLSSLPDGPDPESDSLRAASPTVTRFLASAVTDPLFESTAASSLVTERVDFAAACRLDYATSLVAESASASVCPPSVRGECALRTDVLEDRQEEFECFSAARREGPYSSQWQAAMDAEMASWKSTGTYVEEVPPPGVNIVSGMWIFRVKRPPGSPPVFKARYVARGFSRRQGVDFF